MAFSSGFKINVNKLNANEAVLVLLEITHPFLATPVRLVNDNKNLVSNGNDFIATSFTIKRQNDVQGELPSVALVIPNIGRSLVKWIDSTGGGKGASMKVMLARRSVPDVYEESLVLSIQRVTITTDAVSFSLIVQNDLVKKSVRFIYDLNRAPGIF